MTRTEQGLAILAATVLDALPNDEHVRSLLRSLPTHLHRSGLAATAAFIASGSDRAGGVGNARTRISEMITGLMRRSHLEGAEQIAGLGSTTTLSWLGGLPSADYARLTAEVAAALLWIKRLSEARGSERPAHEPEGAR